MEQKKNTVSEILKNLLEGLKSRFDKVEERIIELKDRSLEEQKEKGKKKNNEESLRGL